MASILKRERRDGSVVWQAQIRVSGYRSISQSFNSEKEAKTYAAKAEKEFLTHIGKSTLYFEEQFYNSKVAHIVREYMKSDEALSGDKGIVPTLLNHIGDIKVKQLTKKSMKTYIDKLLNTPCKRGSFFKPATIRRHMILMSKAYAYASQDLNLPRPDSVFSSKLLPKGWDEKRERRISFSERTALLQYIKNMRTKASPFYRILVSLAIETGARLQELMRAEWSAFDLENHLWVIPREHTKSKTERYIPLSHRATQFLTILRTLRSDSSPRLFHLLSSPSVVSASFTRIFRKAHLTNLRFHDLRHEAISQMVSRRRNLTIYEIMRIVGHRSIEMINRYCHLRSDEMIGRFRGKTEVNHSSV